MAKCWSWGFYISRAHPLSNQKKKKKKRKHQHVKRLRFSLNTNKHKYPKNCPLKIECSLTDTEQSLQYTIKTYPSGPPMPNFEANMNYIHQALPAP